MTSPTRRLATTLVERLLTAQPFAATDLGLREYDALVPDASAAAEDALAADLAGIGAQAAELAPDTPADAVTRQVMVSSCERQRRQIGARAAEYTVTAMPFTGPASLMAVFARSVLPDPQAAADYLDRAKG